MISRWMDSLFGLLAPHKSASVDRSQKLLDNGLTGNYFFTFSGGLGGRYSEVGFDEIAADPPETHFWSTSWCQATNAESEMVGFPLGSLLDDKQLIHAKHCLQLTTRGCLADAKSVDTRQQQLRVPKVAASSATQQPSPKRRAPQTAKTTRGGI